MKSFLLKTLLIAVVSTAILPFAVHAQSTVVTTTQEPNPISVHVFKRDDCTYCKAEAEFLEELSVTQRDLNFTIVWHDVVTDEEANSLYQQITTLKKVPRITPITIVGDTLIQGFDAPETTGERIIAAIGRAHAVGELPIEDFIAGKTIVEGTSTAGCDSGDVCAIDEVVSEFSFKLPLVGVVDLQTFSLATLAVVLGTIDGFNPCAMWVLITFLLILMQIGNRKRMLQIAGLFLIAEAVMYGLILNVWYSAWDFVGLDRIITPLIGLLAIGGGLYFLHKYKKSRDALVCDVASIKTQSKIQERIHSIAKAPLTIAAIGGIIAIAFSVNIIEFACSVGIPQAFTKILELNQLSFLQTQGYTLLYILFYMIDDFIVFGFAAWGIQKIQSAEKYSRASMLFGGILMVLLGSVLLFAPTVLTF
ncbi:glutaredoxin [Candidatus Kaiserbacteria bacterium]|nr:MAG: glutaredoxin [Candidatus Kaiserbacteria bacterium]